MMESSLPYLFTQKIVTKKTLPQRLKPKQSQANHLDNAKFIS